MTPKDKFLTQTAPIVINKVHKYNQNSGLSTYEAPSVVREYQRDDQTSWSTDKYQNQCIHECLEKKKAILAMQVGTGKAEPITNLVPTYDKGLVPMGDLKVGDKVIARDGKPTKIKGVYPQGLKKVLRLYFSDNTFIDCCEEHLWVAMRHGELEENVITAKDMKKALDKGLREFRLPYPVASEFKARETYCDPYELGCVYAYAQKEFGTLGKQNRKKRSPKPINQETVIEAVLNSLSPSFPTINESHIYIKDLKLRVPPSIMYNSIEVREKFLQGFCDRVSEEKTVLAGENLGISDDDIIYIRQEVKEMLPDLFFMARSVGAPIAQVYENAYTIKLKLGTGRFFKNSPFKRHHDFMLDTRGGEKHLTKKETLQGDRVVRIEKQPEQMCQCIEVEDEEHCYYTGWQFRLTHNTIVASLTARYARQIAGQSKDLPDVKRILVITEKKLCPIWADNMLNEGFYTAFDGAEREKEYYHADADIFWFEQFAGAGKTKLMSSEEVRDKNRQKSFKVDRGKLDEFGVKYFIEDGEAVLDYDMVIIDEGHNLANFTNQNGKAVKRTRGVIAFIEAIKPKHRTLVLTATPYKKHFDDFYPLARLLRHPLGQLSFTQWQWLFSTDTQYPNKTLLLNLLGPSIIYRTQKDMGVEIKYDAIEVDVPRTQKFLEEQKEIMLAEKFVSIGVGKRSNLISTARVELTKSCSKHKLPWVYNFIKANPDKRVMVISGYNKEVLFTLGEKLDVPVFWAGTKDKKAHVEAFNNGDYKVFLAQRKIAESGLNVPGADVLIMLDLDYTVSSLIQCFGRVLRRDRVGKPTIIVPRIPGSIDEKVYKRLKERKDNHDEIVKRSKGVSSMLLIGENEENTEQSLKQEANDYAEAVKAQSIFASINS